MRIQCPACQTIYEVKADAIGGKGRQVRCAKCGDTWQATAMPQTAGPQQEQSDQRSRVTAAEATASKPAKPKAAKAAKVSGPSGPPQSNLEDDDAAFASEDKAANDAFASADSEIAGETANAAAREEDADDMDDFASDDVAAFDADSAEEFGSSVGDRTAQSPPGVVDAGLSKLQQARARIGISEETTLAAPIAAPTAEKKPSLVNDYVKVAAAGIAALLLLFGPLLYRHQVVDMVPDMAGFYSLVGLDVNLRGLDFKNIETFHENDGDTDILVVEGFLVNVDGRKRAVPAVRLALLGEDASELYAWAVEPRAQNLEPGETARFRARLASPPQAATDVTLRFVNRSRSSDTPSR